MRTLLLGLAAGLALATAASAEVLDSQPTGFEVGHVIEIAAPAAKVWAALGQVGAWWDSGHSFSGDAKNLTLELKPGGCWCEALPGGGDVRHMSVVFVDPGKTLVLEGALGPLQSTGAMGHMTWKVHDTGASTTLTVKYDVGGYIVGGIDKWATPVDTVITAQAERLKHYAETGKPQ